MRVLTRRAALAGCGTLASLLIARKLPAAERLLPTAERLVNITAERLVNITADDLPEADLTQLMPPVAAPDIAFTLEDGTERRLSAFKGRGMVLNFWATWCAPCVAEMPALATLARALAPHDVAVMPLSSDRGGVAAVRRFYDKHAITGLPVLLDPKGAAARAFDVKGIPATVVIDRQGRQCARLDGAADWSRPAVAQRILRLVG